MIITNDIIREATLQPQSNIGNRIALDAANPSSNVGTPNFWYDLSGNFNRATLSNVTITNQGSFTFIPAIDPVTTFGSTMSYGTIVDSKSADISGWEITTEIWVKFTSLFGYNQNSNSSSWPLGINMNTQGLFGKWGETAYYPKNYGLEINDTNLIFRNETTSSELVSHIVSYDTIGNFPGNWVQIVYKQDSNGWSMILNGDNIIGQGTDSAILIPDNQPLLVGTRGDYTRIERSPYAFYGEMSVFNVWDRALTDAEIKNNYNFYIQRYI